MSHILIVEDHQDIFENIERKLQTIYPEFKISLACNCDIAYDIIKKSKGINPVTLLVLDLEFNQRQNTILKDGKALLKQLKEKSHTIPTVIYTSHDEAIMVASILDNFEVNGFVVKSHNSSKDLCFAIDKALNNDYFFSHTINKLIQNKLKFRHIIDSIDIIILEHLPNISSTEEWKQIIPNSASSSGYMSYNAIKTRLEKIKDELNVANDKQLVLKLRQIGYL